MFVLKNKVGLNMGGYIKKYNVKIEAYLPIDENPVFEDLKIITLKAEIDE